MGKRDKKPETPSEPGGKRDNLPEAREKAAQSHRETSQRAEMVSRRMLAGADESQLAQDMLNGRADDSFLYEPDFLRELSRRTLLRDVTDPESTSGQRARALGMLIKLEGLDKSSPVAQAAKNIRQVQERLSQEAIDVTPPRTTPRPSPVTSGSRPATR